MSGPRILTFDIETLPVGAHVWGLFDQNIGLPQISEDWAMLSYAAKFLGEKRVHYADTRNAQTIRDDKDALAELCSLIDQADVVVGQNVIKFDMRKIRARAIQHNLPPFREPKLIDTMRMAKGVAAFTSNKLEYLSGILTNTPKLKHAKYPGFELWLGIMKNEPAAWAELKRYNVRDVVATENLYLALRPWAKGLPNLAAFYADDEKRCPRCGSVNLTPYGTYKTNVSEYPQYVCGCCGGFSHGRYTINSKDKRKALLAI